MPPQPSKKDDLFDLITSLSRSEKRYVKIYASQHTKGEKSNYIRLFEAMDGQKGYSEAALLKKFKGEKFIKHLSSEKNYLFRFILKALRAYQREASVPLELLEILMESEILQERGLYGRSLKWLDRADQIAEKHELFWMQLEILDRKRLLIKAHEKKAPREKIQALVQSKDELLARISNQYLYQDMYEEVFLESRKELLANEKEGLQTYENRLNALESQTEDGPASFSARIYADNLKATLHSLRGENDRAWEYYAELISLWESTPHLCKMYPNRYRIALSNFISSCFENQRYDDIPSLLKKMREVPTSHFNLEAEVFQNSYFFEFLYLLTTGQLQEATELVPTIMEGLVTYGEKINHARVLAFYFNIAMTYFLLEDFSNSQTFLLRIIDESGSRHRVDLQRAARLIHLLIQLEKGHFDLLEYQYRSVQRYLNKQEVNVERITLFMKFIYQAFQQGSFPLPDSLYESLIAAMQTAGHLPGGVEISLWAKSKLEGKSLTQLFLAL